MTTGLSISEINNLVGQGAVISDDGTIQLVSYVQTAPDPDPSEEAEEPITAPENPTADESENESSLPTFVGIVGCILCAGAFYVLKRKQSKAAQAENYPDQEGEAK